MSVDTAKLDEQITRLREGDTLSEIEVKVLCEKVRTRSKDLTVTAAGKQFGADLERFY